MLWKQIPGLPGYEVTERGDVRSWRSNSGALRSTPRLMRPRVAGTGYLVFRASVSVGGRKKTWSVHRAVLEAFVGPCPDGMQCLHANGDRSDARLSNLRWGTPAENAADRTAHGTVAACDRHGCAILSKEQVIMIRMLKGIADCREMAWWFGVSPSAVVRARSGATWRLLPPTIFAAEQRVAS